MEHIENQMHEKLNALKIKHIELSAQKTECTECAAHRTLSAQQTECIENRPHRKLSVLKTERIVNDRHINRALKIGAQKTNKRTQKTECTEFKHTENWVQRKHCTQNTRWGES